MKKLLSILTLFFFVSTVYSQSEIWTEQNYEQIEIKGEQHIFPEKFKTYNLDFYAAKELLATAPLQDYNGTIFSSNTEITIPMPDGSFELFKIVESPVCERELSDQYPNIKTFLAYAPNHPEWYSRFDITPVGFHAMIMGTEFGSVYIDPITHLGEDKETYLVYYKKDFRTDKIFECGVEQFSTLQTLAIGETAQRFGSCELRTYRLALAATGEYTAFHGGTVAGALAAQVTTMNRVNGVYEKDMAIHMNIVANNNLIIYTNSGSDPYTNNSGGAMLGENQTNVDAVIGSANYDIGHVFSTGGGGIASLQSPCNSSRKAQGVTGSNAPVNDPFDIDYVSHEMGHQFGGNHTFNGTNGSCGGGNRNLGTAFEPGSGTTIQAYAGICTGQNVQNNSDDYFHGVSLEEIGDFITNAGDVCPVKTALSNNEPSLTYPNGTISIPANTPFSLTALGVDVDGDVLTYCWEQMDNENSTQPPVANATGGPNFRSFSPTTSPTRYFPNLPDVIAGNSPTWEVLPSVSRTMHFRVVVRDNAPGGGCNDEVDITVNIENTGSPFIVTSPNSSGISWDGNTIETVTWNVANTNNTPISCGNVNILISYDGGLTFPDTLAENVPNDGSQPVTVPNIGTTDAYIMVQCANGTFFDVSDNNFTINPITNDFTLNATPTSQSICTGDNLTYTVEINKVGVFNGNVSLSTTGLPSGVTANFSSNNNSPVYNSTLSIGNTGGLNPGTYNFNVTATGSSGTKTFNLSFTVIGNLTGNVNLTNPNNGALNISNPVNFTWDAVAGTNYNLLISSDSNQNNPVESAYDLSTNNYTSNTLQTNTTYYWSVIAFNACDSISSSINSFTTENCITFNSADVPVNITAATTTTVTSDLIISGTTGTIADINIINLIGTHSYISDLIFTLTSPSGTDVILLDQICTSQNDFDINFDDDAANNNYPCPPVDGGFYMPEEALSAFSNESANGTWTLTIEDVFAQDGGDLLSWGLNICFNTPACPNTFSTQNLPAVCDSSYVNNTWYFQNDTYNDTLIGQSSNGCDSIITYNVFINNSSPETIINNTTCDLNNAGSSSTTFTNISGCDSVVTTTTTLVVGLTGNVNLTNPSDGALDVALPVNFTWDAISNANYTLIISADINQNVIIENVNSLSTNNYTSSVLQTNTSYYWSVIAYNECDSIYSNVNVLTTENCVTFNSADIPVTISDVGTPIITSNLVINGTTGSISDINVVNLTGTHTYISDLIFTLSSPDGTEVIILDKICTTQNDFDINFDDAAANNNYPCPPVDGGFYIPEEALSAFNNEIANGIWILTIEDVFNQDGGDLLSWGLNICFNTPLCTNTFSTQNLAAICDSSFVNNTWYFQNDTYNDTLIGQASNGCDSIITYNVIINNSSPETIINNNTCDQNNVGSSSITFTNIANCDSVVTTNTTLIPSVSNTFVTIECDSAFVNNNWYFNTTSFNQTYMAANGCDSVATFNIIINNSTPETIINNTTCDQNNVGSSSVTYSNTSGCDSVVITNTTLIPSTSSTENISACDSAFVNNNWYYNSTNFNQTYTANNGCDSVVTFNIIINNSSPETIINNNTCDQNNVGSSSITFTNIANCDSVVTTNTTLIPSVSNTFVTIECDSAFVNNNWYFNTTSFNQTYMAANGCDSVATFNIIINNSTPETIINNTTCDQNNVGSSSVTYSNTSGCDSVVITNTTLIPSTSSTENISACDSAFVNNNWYYNSTNFNQTYTANNGCDSVVTFNIVINNSSPETIINNTTCDQINVGSNSVTFTNIANCDSIVTINTTFLQSVSNTENTTACDSAFVNNNWYYNSTTFNQTYTANNGCDSVVTFNIIINNSTPETIINNTTCDQNNVGSSSVTYSNTSGCDSVVITNTTLIPSTSSTENISACDSAFVNNNWYYNSTNFNQTYTANNGCDSVVTFNIIINNSSPETIINNNTCDQNNVGSSSITFTNIANCDSVVTTNTTLIPSVSNTFVTIECDSAFVNNNWYFNTTSFNQTYMAANGCDSVATFNIVINNSSPETIINNTTCNQNNVGTNSVTYTNISNCDSVVTTNTTLLPSSSSIVNTTDCDSTLVDNTWYYSSTSFTQTYTAANGCDSVITFNLTINESVVTSENIGGCKSAEFNGVIYTGSQSISDSFTSANSCDSTHTTNINIASIDTTITQSNSTLTANQENAVYQWIDCDDNNTPIFGATDQSFTATESGNYAVQISNGACYYTSECFGLKATSIKDLELASNLAVYPNPTDGMITVAFNNKMEEVSLSVYTIEGKLLSLQKVFNEKLIPININASIGVYFLKIETANAQTIVKVIKE